MHEARLVRELVTEIDRVAGEEHANHVETVRIEIGALSHVTPESLRGQFELLTFRSAARDADLDITRATNQAAPDAHDIRLVSVVVSGS